jgi:methylene-tetrahydromethanopterin dehydrogenase
MITPLRQMSPFDVNMAIDAGCDHVLTYTHVEVSEVRALVQDAMFSRPPKLAKRTGVFFGGKNAVLALAMMEAAKEAMFRPFKLSSSPIRQDRSRREQRWSPVSRRC